MKEVMERHQLFWLRLKAALCLRVSVVNLFQLATTSI